MLQVPGNRIGYTVLSVGQLKMLQEVITLTCSCRSRVYYLKEPLKLDYLWAALCVLGAVLLRVPQQVGQASDEIGKVDCRSAQPSRDLAHLRAAPDTPMKLSRFGITTLGSVCAFITSPSSMIAVQHSRYAVTAYVSSLRQRLRCDVRHRAAHVVEHRRRIRPVAADRADRRGLVQRALAADELIVRLACAFCAVTRQALRLVHALACGAVPEPGGNPAPSGPMLTSQPATCSGVAGTPRPGPSCAAARAREPCAAKARRRKQPQRTLTRKHC